MLIKDQDDQLERYQRLTTLADQISTGLKNLRVLDAEEKQHLRDAVTAANKEVAAVRAENAHLKKNQVTLWKKTKWVVYGTAIGVVICAVWCKK